MFSLYVIINRNITALISLIKQTDRTLSKKSIFDINYIYVRYYKNENTLMVSTIELIGKGDQA